MPSQRTLPRGWAHLLRTTRREIGLFGLAGLLFVAGVLFEPYNTERPYTFEESEDVQRDHLSLPERLGYAILLRSGYATARLVPDYPTNEEETDEDNSPQDAHLEPSFNDHSELRCLAESPPLKLPGGGSLDVRKLTIAILAAEKYNRTPMQRRLEGLLAGAFLRVGSRLPDFSYGLAQIRPATARRLLQAELGEFQLPDRDLRDILLDDCYSVRLAAQYVESLVKSRTVGIVPVETIDEVTAKVALAYSGSITPTINGLRYVDAVMGAYDLLTWGDSSEESEPDPEPEQAIIACTYFSPGDISGSVVEDSLLMPEREDVGARAGREVHLYFSNQDRGPAAYVRLLAERRRNWLINRIVELGFARDKISVSESDLPQRARKACQEDASLSWAAIEIGENELPDAVSPGAAQPGSNPR